MHLAVGPTAQQRCLGVDTIVVAVAGIVDIAEHKLLLGLGSRGVLGGTGHHADLRALAKLHGDLHGACGLVVLAQVVDLGPPAIGLVLIGGLALLGLHLLAHTSCHGVRHIEEAVVAPAGTPRVGHDPCALLVLSELVLSLAIHAIGVEVKLDAVVVTHEGHGVVHMVGVPMVQVSLTHHAQRIVGLGRADGSRGAGTHSAAQAADAAHDVASVLVLHLRPRGVAIVVEEPPLDGLGTLGGV